MRYRSLHPWDVSPSEAVRIQQELRGRIRLEPFPGLPKLIAGADISYNLYEPEFYAAFVVLKLPSLEIIAQSHAMARAPFPYIPGLLSFREIPALLEAWEALRIEPDVIVCDGQGIAHPRRLGIASHFGLMVDLPTIGCGKTLLCGHYDEPGPEAGDAAPLIDRGETIGYALRTKSRTQPVFVSPGHRMDLPSARRILMACVGKYRIPEPTRQAHLYVNELRRARGAA